MLGKKESIATDFSVCFNKSVGVGLPYFHFHDVYEILFCKTKGIAFLVNDKAYQSSANTLMVYNNTDIHCALVEKDVVYERCVITFNPAIFGAFSTKDTDLLNCFLNRSPFFEHCTGLSDTQTEEFMGLFGELYKAHKENEFGGDILQMAALLKLLVFVNKLHLEKTESTISNFTVYKRIQPVIKYIYDNISSDINLDVLAKVACVSKSHLCVLFKSAVGVPVNKFLAASRVATAKRLLLSGFSIQQTIEKCGFENQSQFNRVFKLLTKNTPGFYIKSKNPQKKQ